MGHAGRAGPGAAGLTAQPPEIVFFTRPSATSPWQERYRIEATVPVTSLSFELSAGIYAAGDLDGGTIRYDNFELCSPAA